MFHPVKKTMALKITKKQYAHLIREISDALKSNISGGGMYDFSAPETYEFHPMSQVLLRTADNGRKPPPPTKTAKTYGNVY